MSKFIKYENIDFRINDDVFYSNSISISLQSNISPVLLSDGTLLRYAPDNTVIGSLTSEFYLTNSFPTYLNVVSNTETSITSQFAGIQIDNCYIKSLSFNAQNFQPILITAEFDWYGKINAVNSTNNLKPFSSSARNTALSNISHSNYTFLMDVDKVFGFDEIFSFSYSEKVDLLPFFANGEIIPFRVAKTNKIKSASVEGNYFKKNDIANIEGQSTNCDLYLKNYNNTLLKIFNISGKIESRSLNVSSDGILQSALAMNQRIGVARNSL
jgi:hypothetical protein